ncbi:uncharacterized protein IL334_005209 [Kwoniella shivajii]|uniref:alpha-L-rhamnosidase n=1 Tax=Kwoniella shivajii TaxID=564305 RepID=A0ABZ1D333_9TREE|nr:hypothetical protein IL334_005209 [Kwoniella shivajii]
MPSPTKLVISRLTFENYRENSAVGVTAPRISWRFAGSTQDWSQASYDIRIKRSFGTEECHVVSSKSVLVPWPSAPLNSCEIVSVSVKANGTDDIDTPWYTTQLEAALLARSDWRAEAISIVSPASRVSSDPQQPSRPFLLHRTFELKDIDKPARLYATALGIYEMKINGQVVGTQVLKPGWTSYDHRLYYQACDVTSLLKIGHNTIEGHIAEGWYSGRLGFLGGKRNLWGNRNGLIAQLMVGDEVIIKTDSTWKGCSSPILFSGIYDGETVDARLIGNGRSNEFEVDILEFPKAKLVLDKAPIRRMAEVEAKEIIITPSGKTILDFGQNLVGWIKINNGPCQIIAGDKITFTHAEVLEDQELGIRPLRAAKCQDTIICGSERSFFNGWEPTFTFHGFRYIQIEGWNGEMELSDITAIVVHTDMEKTGWFHSSHALINLLHENVVWGMKGNFVGVPTDCPQRDERLGWTGDLQVFSKTANFLYDTNLMLSGWLEDLAVEQATNNGVPPMVVPDVIGKIYPQADMPLAVWGDVAVLAPLALFEAFGDSKILSRQYDSMRQWLKQGIPRRENGLWGQRSPDHIQLGDWLDPAAPPDFPGDGRTDPLLVADAYLVHVTRKMAQISRLLDEEEDANSFESEYQDLKQKYSDQYVSKTGRTVSDSQTALALSLDFDLLSYDQREVALGRLDELVRSNVFKVATGFAGTPIILKVLADNDRLHLAYRMLQEKQCPSWLYCVSMGATTVWERWDSMRPDGTINPGEMTSFNHYALGAVASFMHSTIGGLSPLEPGWKRFLIAPRPGGTVTSAEVRHLCPYGLIRCSWQLENGKMTVDISVPPNTRAKVDIGNIQVEVGSGDRRFVVEYDVDPRWPPKPIYHSMTIPLIDEIA